MGMLGSEALHLVARAGSLVYGRPYRNPGVARTSAFSVRQPFRHPSFHDCVLEDGSVPLGFLRLKIERATGASRGLERRQPGGQQVADAASFNDSQLVSICEDRVGLMGTRLL